MGSKSFTYQDFLKMREIVLPYNSYKEYLTDVLRFYTVKEHQQQDLVYVVEDVVNGESGDYRTSKEDLSVREQYSNFGIYFRSLELEEDMTVSIDLPNREYIAFIPKCPTELDENYIKSALEGFVDRNLPEGTVPRWFVDYNEHTDYSTVKLVLNTARDLYPGIDSLISYESLLKGALRDESLNEDIQETIDAINKHHKAKSDSSRGKIPFVPTEVVDITSIVDEIYNRFSKSNNDTADLMITKLDEIGEKLDDNKLVAYYGVLDTHYIDCACYLTYFYHANCFIHTSVRNRFFAQLMEMYYSPALMLAEDRIKYLLNFPTYTFRLTDYTPTYAGTLNRKVTGKVQLCPLNVDETEPFSNAIIREDEVKPVDNLDFSQVKILPLLNHFHLNSSDIKECMAEEAALRKLLVQFEDVISLPEGTVLDVTNTMFIILGGEVCIAYLAEVKFATQTHIVVNSMITGTGSNMRVEGATNKEYSISEGDVYKFFPLEIIHCNESAKLKIMKGNPHFLPVKLQEKMKLDPIVEVKEVRPYKYASKYLLPLSNYSLNMMSVSMQLDSDKLFHEIGMYSPLCTTYRTGGRYKLLSQTDRNAVRKNSSLFSAYGGFHERASKPLTLTEDMMTRKNTKSDDF